MIGTAPVVRLAPVTMGSRMFALVLLAPPVGLSGDYGSILALVLLAAVWMGAVFAEGLVQIPRMPALVVETSLVAFLVGVTLPESPVLLPALVIPVFVGGLVRGLRGVLEVLGAEAVILTATTVPNPSLTTTRELASLLFTWLMVGLGLGLLAAVIRRVRSSAAAGSATPYRDARALITRLLDLSDDLVEGLDPVTISERIVSLTREEIHLVGCVIYAVSGDSFLPLGGTELHPSEHREALLRAVTLAREPAKAGADVALPLRTDAGLVAVLIGRLSPGGAVAEDHLKEHLSELSQRLQPEALQLDTALLFTAVRSEATSEERRRLARELHDGVAQDLASLGYQIDELTADAPTAEMASQSQELRNSLSAVVTELRRSVFNLHNEGVGSLAESIDALARHIESRSGLEVSTSLDMGADRLRPEVEAELRRIAQEAMNNAVRHARASRITVDCTVRAPSATLVVSDDGRGLQRGRDDSHGIRMMRERARRIGASFELGTSGAGRGTTLTVTLPGAAAVTDPIEEMVEHDA